MLPDGYSLVVLGLSKKIIFTAAFIYHSKFPSDETNTGIIFHIHEALFYTSIPVSVSSLKNVEIEMKHVSENMKKYLKPKRLFFYMDFKVSSVLRVQRIQVKRAVFVSRFRISPIFTTTFTVRRIPGANELLMS